MVSTKITSSSVAEIDNKLKTFFSPMVKIEYLENCLKQFGLPNDAIRFCHVQLSELYAQRLMYGPAAREMEAAADSAVTFKDKIAFYLKEINYAVKMNDFLIIDKAYKKALQYANTPAEKEAIKSKLKQELYNIASEYEKKNKRSNAVHIYQRLYEMPITNTEAEKKQLVEKLAKLNSGLGRLKEAIKFEQMLQHPIEIKKDPETDVKKFSWKDLGIE